MCCHLIQDGDKNKHVPKPVVGAFGALAGAASVYGNTPIDVVKTRMQVSLSVYDRPLLYMMGLVTQAS